MLKFAVELYFRKATVCGGNLNDRWRAAQRATLYYTSVYCESAADDMDAKFLTLADYLTYVPYADAGYNALEKRYAETNGLSVAQVRYAKIADLLGRSFDAFKSGQKDALMRFFDNIMCDSPHMDDGICAIAFLSRMCHRLDSAIGYKNCTDPSDENRITVQHVDEAATTKQFHAADVLDLLPSTPKLGADELKFVFLSDDYPHNHPHPGTKWML